MHEAHAAGEKFALGLAVGFWGAGEHLNLTS